MLAPCSPAITDKMARHATSWDRILQPELPPSPPPPVLCPRLWHSLQFHCFACESCFLLEGSQRLSCHWEVDFISSPPGLPLCDPWPSLRWQGQYPRLSAAHILPWVSLLEGGWVGVGEPLPHGGTDSQVQGGLWQSLWPGYCAGPRLS